MFFVYAKRTDTDCFIVVENDAGELAYARMVLIRDRRPMMFADPIRKDDGSEFRTAGVFVVASEVEITVRCDAEGKVIDASDRVEASA